MTHFFRGVVVGLIGFGIWSSAALLRDIGVYLGLTGDNTFASRADVAVAVGITAAILGPLAFWAVFPLAAWVIGRVRHRRA